MLVELADRMRRLEELLTRTLRFSRPLELRVEPVAAADALGNALLHESAAVQGQALHTSVSVDPETPLLSADPAALNDLLANLVRNAVDAQPGGGRIHLRAEPDPKDPSGRVRLSISDEGPGIPRAEREEMFRLFRTEKQDGTGLGLALVRKIAEEHHATVSMEDGEHGHGLTVVLSWPATPEVKR